MKSRVLVTGGTGFTGEFVVGSLLDAGYSVDCLVRPGSDRSRLPDRINWVEADLDRPAGLAAAFRGHRILVSVASLGSGQAPGVVAAAREARIERAIFFSSTSIFTRLNPRSLQFRLQAEALIRESGLCYTILRPTMIYGSHRDRNISRLVRYLQRWRLLVVPGRRAALHQPVLVDDLAGAVVSSLQSACCEGRSYELAGVRPVTMSQMVTLIGTLIGRRTRAVHIPPQPWVLLLRAIEACGFRPPVSSEQVLRLNEDKVFDNAPAMKDFNYRPASIEEGIKKLLTRL